MTNPDNTKGEKPVPLGGELIIPVLALAFTAYYFSTIIDSPWTAQVNAFLVGSILITVILIYFVTVALRVIRKQADLKLGKLLEPYSILPTKLIYIGLIIGYLIAIEWFGFTLSTFLFLASSMMLLNEGKNKRFTIALAAILSLIGYGVFIVAFETRFPDGFFEKFMKSVM